MKKILFFSCIAAALLSFVGCEEAGNDYDGTNYIYLDSQDGKSTIYETDEEPLTVTVTLTKALEEDLVLTFAVEGTAGVVELEGNPVTVKAGEKTASFAVKSLNANVLEASSNYSVKLDAATILPEGVALKESFAFVVSPLSAEALTDAQKAIIDAYKKTSGVDLSKYIGFVNVSTSLTGFTLYTDEPFEKTVTGKTLITLSETSTADAPVLKMLANPMGIEAHMYGLLETLTVDNSETWLDETEYADPCFGILMKGINWNTDTKETFLMSLDGVKLSSGSIEFVAEGEDQYGDPISIVPFEYSFTAYDREILAIESLSKDVEYWSSDATANPAYHLNNTDITEEYAMDEYGEESNWVEASATISNEALVFTFCMATAMDADYTRVVATYTPNN